MAALEALKPRQTMPARGAGRPSQQGAVHGPDEAAVAGWIGSGYAGGRLPGTEHVAGRRRYLGRGRRAIREFADRVIGLLALAWLAMLGDRN